MTASLDAVQGRAPTPLDRTFQLGFKVAYQMMRTYWRLRRPTTHGALVLLWNAGEVLLVRNSYVPFYSAPGGFVKRGEEARNAALRELVEEVGLRVTAQELTLALEVTFPWEFKQDHVKIFEVQLNERPVIKVDNREVIQAVWVKPEVAVTLNVFPPLKAAIQQHLAV
jgi:ADP-ribose pyrophosphatase YjhB (NUDIX family)